MPESKTLEYYEKEADKFAEHTRYADMRENQERFLSYMERGSCILDFGCGSGRDSKYFLDRGFLVEASDGSRRLCRLAEEFTKIPVKHMLFHDLKEHQKYDGVWACASLLHLARTELITVLKKVDSALKPGGIFYLSFKYGNFKGVRDGRYFTDMTEKRFQHILQETGGFHRKEQWITSDVRPGREKEQWLNIILQKIT